MKTIEEHAKKLPPHVLAGLMRHHRWVAGEMLTGEQYAEGLKQFLEEPLQ